MRPLALSISVAFLLLTLDNSLSQSATAQVLHVNCWGVVRSKSIFEGADVDVTTTCDYHSTQFNSWHFNMNL